MDALEETLGKIRPHVKSSLVNQSAPAKILLAVEDTLKEQGQDITPVAYYASLLTTLQEALKREHPSVNLDEGAVVPASLYLLSLVLPHSPVPVIRSKLGALLEVVAPLFPIFSGSAPPLRSQLSLFGTLLSVLDHPSLTSTLLLRKSFASILEFTIDPRPKVRKKAQDVVVETLSSPPPPLAVHPYSDQAAEYIVSVLGTVAGSPGKSQSTEVGIWVCSFVKNLAPAWPSAVRLQAFSLCRSS